MKVYIGADHRGYELKEQLKNWLTENGYTTIDCGNEKYDPADDYPDYASRVSEQLKNGSQDEKGILLCGSGVGVDITANKFEGIRCGFALNPEQVSHARANDDINCLALAADYVSVDQAQEMVSKFLEILYKPEERFERRKRKIEAIEVSQQSIINRQ